MVHDVCLELAAIILSPTVRCMCPMHVSEILQPSAARCLQDLRYQPFYFPGLLFQPLRETGVTLATKRM
ncbi:hypothetical protein AMS68_006860 [Peltaster fructicola]|uniref:Uncharacterized protein n=1 Tax=Peltaster fructicola TaxID=286661 RepID=A0A6H0Y2V1_9PEZI|nr:hypothetical protein AMS68_006860 [Peltaster fructicola]